MRKYCQKNNALCRNYKCEEGAELDLMDVNYDYSNINYYGTIRSIPTGHCSCKLKTKNGEMISTEDTIFLDSCDDLSELFKRVDKHMVERKIRKETPLSEIPTSECSCYQCKSYCMRRPCWGTPEDINKLIDAGYANRLMLDWWISNEDETILLIAPAIKGCEGEVSSYDPRGRCTFYSLDAGLCEIHSLKPIEGKISHHDPNNKDYNTHEKVAFTWNSKEGKSVIEKWRNLTGCKGNPIEAESLSEMMGLFC